MERQRDAEKELSRLRQQSSEAEAKSLAAQAASDGGVVVARRDDVQPDALRSLAQAVVRHEGVRAVVLGGLARRRSSVAIAAATGGEPDAEQLVKTLGKLVGGGGGGSAELAQAGGKDPSQIDAALAEAQRLLSA